MPQEVVVKDKEDKESLEKILVDDLPTSLKDIFRYSVGNSLTRAEVHQLITAAYNFQEESTLANRINGKRKKFLWTSLELVTILP